MENNQPAYRRLLAVMAGHWPAIVATFLFALASSLCNVMATRTIGHAIDAAVGQGNVDFGALWDVLLLLGIQYGAACLFAWLMSLTANRVAYGTARDLRVAAFDKLSRLPLSYYDGTPHGDIVSRFTVDLDNVSDGLALGITNLFSGAVTVVSCLVFMLLLSAPITAVILLVTPLCFLTAYIVARASQKTFQRQQQVVGELSGFVSEMVGNQKTVKAFGYERRSLERFEALNRELYQVGKQAHFASAMVNPSTRVVDHISYLLVGVVGAFTALAGGVSVGVISSFLIYSGQFAKPFNEISGILSNLQMALASMKRVFALMDQEPEAPDSPDSRELVAPKGHVQFEHVAFSYSKERPLIRDLHLDVAPGSLVAIVGPTGAGKTTIVNLLMRFYELDSGRILVDGQDITHITRDSLRRDFGMVLQETWLVAGTIRENIAFGRPDATQAEVEAAARFAHAHSFIRQLPGGYGAVIAEDGGNLSQGQKQLLTIARVMLTNPAMLILDEATSSIDTLTELRVQEAFLNMMKGRTSFVIAHRLSTIAAAHRILVLDKGDVVEQGTHSQLLAAGGLYASLYRSQFE